MIPQFAKFSCFAALAKVLKYLGYEVLVGKNQTYSESVEGWESDIDMQHAQMEGVINTHYHDPGVEFD